jgi:hypothetical protein
MKPNWRFRFVIVGAAAGLIFLALFVRMPGWTFHHESIANLFYCAFGFLAICGGGWVGDRVYLSTTAHNRIP